MKIGFIGGLTGATADLGVGSRNGMILAIEEWNSRGGIDGKPIEFVLTDDQQNEQKAGAGVRTLIEQQVDVIIGPFTSSMAAVVLPEADAARVPMIATTVTSTDFTGKKDVLFRLTSDTELLAQNYGHWLVKTLQLESVVIVVDRSNLSYSESWESNFRLALNEDDISVAEALYFTSGRNDEMLELVEQIAQASPSLVVLVTNAVDAALLVKLIRDLSPGQLITTSEWAGASDQFLQVAGQHAENVYVPRFIDLDNTDSAFRAFSEQYSMRFQQPVSYAAMLAYDATHIVLEQIQENGRGESLLSALQLPKEHKTQLNTYVWDEHGDEISNAVHIATQVINQQYKTLKDFSE